ncbi:ABC transporter ATP-binding protein [Alicyclobacillus sp. SO9]|uniref:ABC transporter ATP-binding protein n=1 Tax=Alicyclobacillus sp. SO9 TaxID=2665646 RepID=UPI0018E8E086|nr:ABC transporter ATP-binding protein [Alicyclobacillus sp. SO9]QQE79019.1 ABC transporter ATP-binding protein [Alicyclobacillus sp. SO9]
MAKSDIAGEIIPHMETQEALRIEQLEMRYGSKQVLDNVNLTVFAGQFVVVVGPSGCGKSTLLNLTAGFAKPSKGNLYIGHHLVSGSSRALPPHKRNIGMVFQDLALWPHMTVYDNVEFPLRYRYPQEAKVKGWARNRVLRILTTVGLADKAKQRPSQLSGGQQQRVALARALVTNPEILLMDEPLSSLDSVLQERMTEDIRRIAQEAGSTVLYVTHNQREAMTLADVVVVMNDGKIEQIGSPEEVYYSPKTKFAAEFFSRSNVLEADSAEILQLFPKFPHGGVRYVGILREHVVLTSQVTLGASEKALVTGKVLSRQFLGSNFEYRVRLQDDTVLVSLSSERFCEDEEVFVGITAFQGLNDATVH